MKFSIRVLLSITVLIALSLLLWRTYADALRDRVRVAELQADIHSLQDRGSRFRTLEEYSQLHRLAELARKHSELQRRKHETLEPRGSDVVSLRSLPTLVPDGQLVPPCVVRLFVPEGRPVWLKFGVYAPTVDATHVRQLENSRKLLRDTPYEFSGPFEIRLPTGDHKVEIQLRFEKAGAIVTVLLDDELLLRTLMDREKAGGFGNVTWDDVGRSQRDYGPSNELTYLRILYMGGYETAVWLHDQPSDFHRFPKSDSSPDDAKEPADSP